MRRRNANFRTEPGDQRLGNAELGLECGNRKFSPLANVVSLPSSVARRTRSAPFGKRRASAYAGIAGLSLAAMLRLRGIEPILIEKAFFDQGGGYVYWVWPMGTHVLHGLNRPLLLNDRHTPCSVLGHGPGSVQLCRIAIQ
jgi:hypothetical protein